MNKRKIAALVLAVTMTNLISSPAIAFAEGISDKEISISLPQNDSTINSVLVSKFNLYGNEKLEEYNNQFKVDRSNIKRITSNGGQYQQSYIERAIDGDFNTHWETGKPNSSNFVNEVIIELNDITELDRVVYGARQESARGKGFAQKFEIYSSLSEDGQDFELVTEGEYNGSVSDIIEIKFEPQKFKRLKFKFVKANLEWASACEFMLYKQDKVSEDMEKLFTDGTMSELSNDYNNIDKIEQLERDIENHPLKDNFISRIEIAKRLLSGEDEISKTVWSLERRGDSVSEAAKRKVWRFKDWQPTGYMVKASDKIKVYVDAEDGEPLPYLVYKQMDRQDNGDFTITLKKGENEITIPDTRGINSRPGVAAGGVLYTVNPYTEKEQSREPKIRIENARTYPCYIKGKDTDEDVMKKLQEYVDMIKEDSSLPDVFEVFGDKSLVNVRATYALDWYKSTKKYPSHTAERADYNIIESLKFWGIEGSEGINSDFNYRYISMLKYLDGGGFMNAGNGVTGFNAGSQGGALDGMMGWGFAHEMGHNLDCNDSSIVEVTNNMNSLYWQFKSGTQTKITDNKLWENTIFSKVTLDEDIERSLYSGSDYMNLTHIVPLWQLNLYDNNYWPELMKIFRENKFSRKNYDEIHDAWVKASCDVFKKDVTEHFERHGMKISDEVKEYAKQYEKLDKKTWYMSDKVYLKNGEAFTDKLSYEITSVSMEGSNVRLNFNMNEEDIKNTLGYEVWRDGQIIGFTAENTFLDKTAQDGIDHEYKIIAYDMNIDSKGQAEANLFAPKLSCDDDIVIGLNSNFNPMDYIKAEDYKGLSIKSDVNVIESNVNTKEKGTYEVKYSVQSYGYTDTITAKVQVVSAVDYLSEMKEQSSTVGWRTLGKNVSPGGNKISLYKNGVKTYFDKGLGAHASSEVIYDLKGKGYTTFKAFAGIDGEVNTGSGLASFIVYGDGKELYNSKNVKCGEDYLEINVDITGVNELKLVTTDGGNGITADNTVWADAKVISNNLAPKLNASDREYRIDEKIDIKDGVTAFDVEDGELTSKVTVKSTDFEEGKAGNFTVTYSVTDSDNNITEKTVNIAVYKTLDVEKSKHYELSNFAKYNEEFKIHVNTISNNGGQYSSSAVGRAIDGDFNTHWETGKPNNNSFKNEVIFGFDEAQNIGKMLYKARIGGKGFAEQFDIYVSESEGGNDFYKMGEGTYKASVNDAVEIDLENIKARRVKFVFTADCETWASIGEAVFYKNDEAEDIIKNQLFTDSTKEEVTEKYNTLDKLNDLREVLLYHPAYELFEADLLKAEQDIRKYFPQINIPKDVTTKVGTFVDLKGGYSASDIVDGNLTDRVIVEGIDKVKFNKPGIYDILYKVTDKDGNETNAVRHVNVIDMEDYKYVSDLQWKATTNSYGKFNKDVSQSGNPIRLTGENGQEITYKKGLGSHAVGTVTYDLEKINAKYFTSWVGVDRQMYNSGAASIEFEVFLDGVRVYNSGVMKAKDKQKFVQVDLAGAKELKLVINDGGNGIGSDHGNFADAKFYYVNEENPGIDISDLEMLLEKISKLDKDLYKKESWDNLISEEEIVKTALKTSYDKQKINELTKSLKNAYDNLEKAVDKSSLIEYFMKIQVLDRKMYTQESWNNLIQVNKIVYAALGENYNQQIVDDAYKKLVEACENLKLIK